MRVLMLALGVHQCTPWACINAGPKRALMHALGMHKFLENELEVMRALIHTPGVH